MPRPHLTTAFVVVLLFIAPAARAALAVGDKPDLKVNAMDGSKIDLAAHKGKMILISFWAGHSVTTRTAMSRLGDLLARQSEKGLVIVGVNCDRKMSVAVKNIADLYVTWPQYHERGFSEGLGANWGVTKLPYYFLIGPDGTLIWSGYKTAIEDVVLDEMIKHPPVLVSPEVVAAAKSELEAVEKALLNHDRAAAIQKFAHIPDAARKNAEFAKQYKKIETQINEATEKLLSEIEPLIAAKNFVEAVKRLKELSIVLAGSSAQAKVRQRLDQLLATPEAKPLVEQSQRESTAAIALAAAQKLREDKQHESAYSQFKTILEDFPATPAALAADDAIKEYERDESFMRRLKDNGAGSKARQALALADNYRHNGRIDLAKSKYQQVIKDFPGTTFAEQAQAALESMK